MRSWHIVLVLVLVVTYFAWGGSPSAMPAEPLFFYDRTYTEPSGKRTLSCPKNRCLTIYLAPWCPQCRRSHSTLLEVVRQLEARGIATTVILGLDEYDALVAYAADFPFPVYLDQNKALFDALEMKGVPSYVVWLPSRDIITREAGGAPSADILLKVLGLEQSP